MPLSALLTTDDLWHESKGGTARSPFHTSTFGGNTRACAAGLAMLEVLMEERLADRAAASGIHLLDRLRDLQRRQPLIADIRGRGLMIGIEFTSETCGLIKFATGGLINRLSREYFAALAVKQLLTKHGIMTGLTLNNQNVLRLQPPLNIERRHLNYLVESLEATLEALGSFTRAAMRNMPDIIRARFA